MSEKQIPNESLKLLFSKLEEFVTTKTVVGEPIKMGEVTMVPFVDVSVGIATGVTSANGEKNKDGGAGGMGAKMTPTAVLVVHGDNVQMINMKNPESAHWLAQLVPIALEKIEAFFAKKSDEESDEEEEGDTP